MSKLFSRSLRGMSILISMAFLFAGLTYAQESYEYYSSGLIKSITYDPPQSGVAFEEFLDEDLYGWGFNWRKNPWGYSSRLLRQILSAPDPARDDAVTFEYKYGNGGIAMADLDGDGIEDPILAYEGLGLYKYQNGVRSLLGGAVPGTIHVADLEGDGKEDLILTYNGSGLFKYQNGKFTKLGGITPDSIFVADLDGDGKDELILTYEGYGLYKYQNGALTRIGGGEPETILVADIDGDGKDDLILMYEGFGLYKYQSGRFTQLGGIIPETAFVADIDGDGKDDLILTYKGLGLYKYQNGGFTRLGGGIPETVLVADIDGDGKDDLILTYEGQGLFKYQNGAFTRLHASVPKTIRVADLDGDGKDDLILSYEGFGLYKYQNGGLTLLGGGVPETILVADLDGDGKDDLILIYEGQGLFKHQKGTFTQLGGDIPKSIQIAKNSNAGGGDYLILEYEGLGLYEYRNNTFTFIGSGLPNSVTTTEKAYDINGDLIYTATYDGSGDLISKEYATPSDLIEHWDTTSWLIKRKTEVVTGDIYEYLNENWNDMGYGRISLIYKAADGEYRTYAWDSPVAGQVSVNEYSGEYSVSFGADLWDGVVASDKIASYIYDHKGEQVSLDTSSNDWVLREKVVYQAGGSIVLEKYIYDALGRLTRDDQVAEDRYYLYEYHPSPDENQVYKKSEYERSTDIFIKTYVYDTDGNVVGIIQPSWTEYYNTTDPLRWKRDVTSTGEVKEYKDEYLSGDEWNTIGRMELYYAPGSGKYQTWDWLDADSQVRVTEYNGDYIAVKDSPNKSSVLVSERRESILYDRVPALDGSGANLNTSTNGWIEREKEEFAADGVTVLKKYYRNTLGDLVKEIDTAVNVYSEYQYHTSPGVERVIRYKIEYTYDEADEAAILAGTLSGTFQSSYEYVDSDYMVKRDSDGTVTTFLLNNGDSYNNTYLNPADG
ncbi:MAG: VCBS repeat-containing protein, partial [Candidatus Omnitrophota bacterium]